MALRDPNIAYFYPVVRGIKTQIEYIRKHNFRVDGHWKSPFDTIGILINNHYKALRMQNKDIDAEEKLMDVHKLK